MEDDIFVLAGFAIHRDPELVVLCRVLDRNGSRTVASLFIVAEEGEIAQEPTSRSNNVTCIVMADKMRTLGPVEIVQKKDDLVQAIEEPLIRVKTGCLGGHVCVLDDGLDR